MTRIKDYFCSDPMAQQLNALASKFEGNTGNVNEVSSKFAELIRSPLLEKMEKKGKQKSTFFDNECERKKEELNHMLEYVKKSKKETEKLELLRQYRSKRKEYKLMIKMKKLEFRWREQNELAHFYKINGFREFWKRVS